MLRPSSRALRAPQPMLGVLVALSAFCLAACSRQPQAAAPSVLLITLDTTRADRLGAYGGPAGATPQLDALAARAVVFERAFAVAPMTLPAHASMLTGLLPTRTGVRWNGEQRLPRDIPTLAESFSGAGYDTAAFVSAAVLDDAFGLERGFSTYDDDVGSTGGQWRAERPASVTVERAMAWLEAVPEGRPVLLWVHVFEAHDPYQPPPPFAARFAEDPYLGEIAAADDALGKLLQHPRWRPDGRAIVAVLGDHGESLGEHGEATHGILLYDGALRVPWLLAAPGLEPARVGFELSQVDLAPTLLELAGLSVPASIDGKSVVRSLREGGEERPRTLYAESLYANFLYGWAPLRSARRAGWKLISGARSELHETGSDPGEKTNRAGEAAAQAATLERALAEVQRAERSPDRAAVTDSLRRQLQGLGYLSGGGEAAPASVLDDPRDRIALHERFRDVEGKLRAGDIEAAQRESMEILASDPDNPLAQRTVEVQLRNALAEVDDDEVAVRLRVTLAQILARAGAKEDAREQLAAAADASVTGAAALGARAFARMELGRVEEARSDWMTLSQQAPSDGSAALNLASLALSQRRWAEAERWARAALAVAPSSPVVHNTLAIALEEQGSTDAAGAEYRAALAVDPSYWRAELNLGLLHARRGDTSAAIASLERVLARAPREPLAHLNLGLLLGKIPGRSQAARGHLETFLALAPSHPRAGEVRARLAEISS
jgi:arylsulfatase A-like enzyme/Flp pilus assembly protein TadD